MSSAPRDAADQRPGQNKNRGTQVVKLSVPFLFSSAHSAVPEPCVPRSGCRANQNAASCQEKENMEWRNGTERLQTLLFSGATWLELANCRCENRIPQSVSLVNPYLKIFRNFFAVKFFLPDSCTLYRHSWLRLCKIHRFPLAFDRYLCYYSSCSTATPHLAAAFWQQGGSQGCSVSKEAL